MAKTSQKISVKLREYYSEDFKKRRCCICKTALNDSKYGPRKIACSTECKVKARAVAEKTLRQLSCKICEKDLLLTSGKGPRPGTCSEACRIEAAWRRNLYRVHHIRIGDFNEILLRQNGVCGSCKENFNEDKRKMNVDHDHSCCSGRIGCGKCIRGILCNGCNGGMGLFKDDPEKLIAAATYLNEFKEKRFQNGYE